MKTERPNNEKLKEKRERLGLTQDELGKILGTTRNTIARWERGEVQPQSWNMLWLALTALEIAKNNHPSAARTLSEEVDKILEKIGRNGETLSAEVRKMKKAMNLV